MSQTRSRGNSQALVQAAAGIPNDEHPTVQGSSSTTTRRLERTAFATSRMMDFFSRRELIAQTGHAPEVWPLVVIKELLDNAIDATEDASTAPTANVQVGADCIAVTDNGPGIDAETVRRVLDFSVRVSSREAYVSPTRGAQGNALKTVAAMPFVLDGKAGRIEIQSRGMRHEINIAADTIRQEPVVEHREHVDKSVKTGTSIRVYWPDSASSILDDGRARFLQIADDFTVLNPHLDLTVDWRGERTHAKPTNPAWRKWLPTDPTSPHWYDSERFGRLIAGYIAHDAERGNDRTVRALVAEFDGLTGTAKQKTVLEATGLSRVNLSALRNEHGLRTGTVSSLLSAMQANTKHVKPAALGTIGKDHLLTRFAGLGVDLDTFNYKRVMGETADGLPWIVETAFGWRPDCEDDRRLITGVNWSPGILNPFRELGEAGESLDAVLQEQRAGRYEPVVLLLHLVCPRVAYTDRGKSAIAIGGPEFQQAESESQE